MEKFCTNCGAERVAGNKFCGACGTPFESGEPNADNAGKVFIKNSDRRVPVGSVKPENNDEIMDAGGVWALPGGEEAENAGKPFDSSQVPAEGDLVPEDCMWSIHAYPGKPNVHSKRAQKVMTEMGQLAGRPYDEIVRFADPPNSRQPAQDGLMGAVWLEMGFLSAWSVTLVFDSYGVCGAVLNESAI